MKANRHRVTVQWGDTDPAKIVFYPNYFSWFDESTRVLFESVGLDWDTLMTTYGIVGLPIVEVKATFARPCVFRDEIEVESTVAAWKGKTLQVDHQVWNRGEIAVRGYEVRAWCKPDPDDARAIRAHAIPQEIIAAFEVR